jgi:hypothetical protein
MELLLGRSRRSILEKEDRFDRDRLGDRLGLGVGGIDHIGLAVTPGFLWVTSYQEQGQ